MDSSGTPRRSDHSLIARVEIRIVGLRLSPSLGRLIVPFGRKWMDETAELKLAMRAVLSAPRLPWRRDPVPLKEDLPDCLARHLSWLPERFRDISYWNSRFDRFARLFSTLSGRPLAFNIALAVILVWVVSGPLFGFSDTWQLVINTATTIVTFLMVFLIQHTQNRDTEALQVKLDELIRAIEWADNTLLDLEELEEEELKLLRKQYVELAKAARKEAARIKSGPA